MQSPDQPRPVGRPAQGITKKVSLTLSAEEWKEIDQSGMTTGAFVKDRMKKAKEAAILEASPAPQPPITQFERERRSVDYPRHYAEERWDIYQRFSDEELPSDAVIEAAKQSMYKVLYPNQAENAVLETRDQYICPFTGKRFSSMDKLVRSAIPTLIQWATAQQRREAERAAARSKENS
ncbi:hypothetical protein [Paenibacillus illinoisensis]|uniref:hypothetical protein n=1 Tax=Paenibacillus illinoisensis TaxID=59845 RepID=UPI00301D2C2A